jgi:hypothetical protein
VQQGMLTRDEGKILGDLKFEKGELTINGTQIPLGATN